MEKEIIQLKPDNLVLLEFEKGISHLIQKKFTEAIIFFENVLSIAPTHFDSLQLLALLKSEIGEYAIASKYFKSAIQIDQSNPIIYNNYGLLLQKEQDWKNSISIFKQAIKLKPDYSQAFNNIGTSYKNLNLIKESLNSYEFAIQYDPNFAEAYYNRANICRELRQYDRAYVGYKSAISLDNRLTNAYLNFGLLFAEIRKYGEAFQCFKKVIEIDSKNIEAYNNLGNLCQKINDFDQALIYFQNALVLNPSLAQIYNNIGNLHHRINSLELAKQAYKCAISINSNFAEAHWNNSLVLLLGGNFHEGWKEFEWRQHSDYVNKIARAQIRSENVWLGNFSITNKSILIQSEQGLGDTIHFSRFVPLIEQLGAEVTLQVQPSLVSLLKSLPSSVRIVPLGEKIPVHDCRCPLLSLPLALGIDARNIPFQEHYLNANNNLIYHWKSHLGQKSLPRVGLVCSGSKDHTNDQSRSFSLEQIIPHLSNKIEYHLIQNEIRENDLKTLSFHKEIKIHHKYLNDFDQTAALVSHMDLVISVDTSVAHLCGALGKSIFLLLPYRCDWRWLTNTNESIWYSSLKLFRQPHIGYWDSVFHNVTKAIHTHLSIT